MYLDRLIIYSERDSEVKKTYPFNSTGINIILGEDREKDNNGVGKTTMVESIQFVVGGRLPRELGNNDIIKDKNIIFILILIDGKKQINLARKINEPQSGFSTEGTDYSFDLSEWKTYEEEEYNLFLNEKIFALKDSPINFSSLREYLIRDEKSGFNDIILPNRQAIYQYRYLNFLMGLPCDYEFEIKKKKDKQRDLNAELREVNEIKSEIDSLKLLQKELKTQIEQIDSAIVANELATQTDIDEDLYKKKKEELNYLRVKNLDFKEILRQYNSNINDLDTKLEDIKKLGDVELFYAELIDYFPNKVKRNFEELNSFYSRMVEDRGKYFKLKIDKLKNQIEENTKKIKLLESDINSYTKIYKNIKIAEDIKSIVDKKNKKLVKLVEINKKINIYNRKPEITSKINEIKGDILTDVAKMTDDFGRYQELKDSNIDIFSNLVEKAYSEAGTLDFELITNTNLNQVTGRIKIFCSIKDEGSHGRLYMKINMFDLTWFISSLKRDIEIPFLIHDGSYSKPSQNPKENLILEVSENLNSLNKGQYFITANFNELSDDFLLENEHMVVANLRRGNEDRDRFMGFSYG